MAWRLLRRSLCNHHTSSSLFSNLSSSSSSSIKLIASRFVHVSSKSSSTATTTNSVDLSDPEELQSSNVGANLYSKMSTVELVRTFFNLQLLASEPLVGIGINILNSRLLDYQLLRVPIFGVVKRTVYSQFCAGENAAEASETLERLWQLGLRGVLDYSMEDAPHNIACDHNLQQSIATVHQSSTLSPQSVSFACVKITAIAPLKLLEKVSSLLRWQHKDSSNIHLPWKDEDEDLLLPIFAPQSPTYHCTPHQRPSPLSKEEIDDLSLSKVRLWNLCTACEQRNLPLLVDAEYSSVQPAIDYLTYQAAVRFNKHRPLVYATIQAYLKDSLPRLQLATEAAWRKGIHFGVKLVRGAYLSRETHLATSLGADSPIHENIQQTHHCYDQCTSFMLQSIASSRPAAVVLATHNFDSGNFAASKSQEYGITKGDPKLQFAQLKGMADKLSLSLVNSGFQVSKLLPFGRVEDVIPYLIRRAEENKGVLANSEEDRKCIKAELLRRFHLL